MDGWMDHSHIK